MGWCVSSPIRGNLWMQTTVPTNTVRTDGERETFHNKNRFKELMTTKLTPQRKLRRIIQKEGNYKYIQESTGKKYISSANED